MISFVDVYKRQCLYIYNNNNNKILLAIYVDDGLIAASNESLIDKLLNDLSKKI